MPTIAVLVISSLNGVKQGFGQASVKWKKHWYFSEGDRYWTLVRENYCTNKLCCFCYRKDMEVKNLNSKLEDEQSLVAQLQRKIKELQVRVVGQKGLNRDINVHKWIIVGWRRQPVYGRKNDKNDNNGWQKIVKEKIRSSWKRTYPFFGLRSWLLLGGMPGCEITQNCTFGSEAKLHH